MTAFSPLLRLRRTWSFHVIAFQRTSKKLCTRIYNAGAQSLFRSLDILFGGVFIAVVVMACLLSLACNRQSSETALIFLEGVINMEVLGLNCRPLVCRNLLTEPRFQEGEREPGNEVVFTDITLSCTYI